VPGAEQYSLSVGITPDEHGLGDVQNLAGTSYRVPALGTVSSDIRLFARLGTRIGGVWHYTETTFFMMPHLLFPFDGAQDVPLAGAFVWTASDRAQSYYLYVGRTRGGKDLVNTGEIHGTYHQVSALPSATVLYARLWTKIDGRWSFSDSQFRTADVNPPVLQGGLTAHAVSDSSIVISWQPALDDTAVAGYEVFRNGSTFPIATVSTTSFTDSELAASTTYSYQITAFDAADNISPRSPPVSATTEAVSLSLAGNGRYLLDQSGRPYFINGESARSLIAQLSREDADLYLENRRLKGYDAVLVNLVEHRFARFPPANYYGDAPFAPTGSFDAPNDEYFAHADWVISNAATKGIVVFLAPLYLGSPCGPDGWCAEVQNSSIVQMQGWGAYVGNRYKNFRNIVWVVGGGDDPVAHNLADKIEAFVTGLRSADTVHLITAQGAPEASALHTWPAAPWLDLNSIYTYEVSHAAAATEFGRLPFKPFFLIEGLREHERASTVLALRSQAYWSVLSGGTVGHFFGNCPIWSFDAAVASCESAVSWRTELESEGSVTLALVGDLLRSRPFYELAPDRDHTVLVGGYESGATLAVAARTSSRSTVIAYIPTARPVTIDMSAVSGTLANAWWYNPRNGAATFMGAFSTGGPYVFTPPDANDWILVIDDASLELPPPGT
jgi:hypothetical protein